MEIAGVELEAWLALATVIMAAAVYGLKKYQAAKADGKITLSELIAAIEDPAMESHAEDVSAALSEVKKKKSE